MSDFWRSVLSHAIGSALSMPVVIWTWERYVRPVWKGRG
jgi:hypothetical protein